VAVPLLTFMGAVGDPMMGLLNESNTLNVTVPSFTGPNWLTELVTDALRVTV
jgi:hypothetical protein